jgi:glycosyltransferase involved in cell wall biosynthesis
MSPSFVTLILPIRNESAYIGHALTAILKQDYPADCMETLIVDGMSIDDTRSLIHNFSKEHPALHIRILDNPHGIVPTGMNIALRQAKGEIVIRVDGHCLIAPDYISKCVDHLKKNMVDGVGGPMESIGETKIAKAIALGMSSPFGVGNSAFRTTSGRNMIVDTVPFPAYTWEVIKRAGFYDEELVRNQDDEYNYRIREMGGKILLADDVRSTYFSRSSLKGLWRQYFQYGYWKVRVLQKHPRQMSLRQFIPPVFVLALLGSALLFFYPAYRTFSMIVPLPYLMSNIVASIWTASKQKFQYLGWLPLIFLILHLSYGLGFLIGLITFWNRWSDKAGKVPEWSDAAVE